MDTYISDSAQATVSFGTGLGKTLQGGEVLILTGGLGCGKTTLTKGIGEGLGVDDVVTSPSFTIMQEYTGRCTLAHFDFYRIDDPREMDSLIEEYAYAEGIVVVVEWGGPLLGMLDRYIHVSMEIAPPGRVIRCERRG
jgi:tRNA threonylcarbamoyladenosine biosynthesis protein TsaE